MEKENVTPSVSVRRKKIRMILWIAGIALLGLLSYILLMHPELFTVKKNKVTSMYSDRLLSYSFYEADYELDITKDERYMGLDRYIHVQLGNENFAITDGNYAPYGEAVEFFAKYFETVIAGDAEAYNSLFTDAYYQYVQPYERFTPQMIYGIKLQELSAVREDAGDWYVYNVTYAIHRNNGTFRNDMGSDAFKTLIFTLVEENGELKINAIDYYRIRN